MRFFLYFLVLVIPLGCMPLAGDDLEKFLKPVAKNIAKEQPSAPVKVIDDQLEDLSFDNGLSLEFDGKASIVKVKKLPEKISSNLVLKNYQRVLEVWGSNHFKETCEEMDYKNKELQITNFINADIDLDLVELNEISKKVKEIKGVWPRAISWKPNFNFFEIVPHVDYFTESESARFNSYLKAHLKKGDQEIHIEAIMRLEDPPMKDLPIHLLARFLCGLANKEARLHILFGADRLNSVLVEVKALDFY